MKLLRFTYKALYALTVFSFVASFALAAAATVASAAPASGPSSAPQAAPGCEAWEIPNPQNGPPCIPNPDYCQDSTATNYHQLGTCEYPTSGNCGQGETDVDGVCYPTQISVDICHQDGQSGNYSAITTSVSSANDPTPDGHGTHGGDDWDYWYLGQHYVQDGGVHVENGECVPDVTDVCNNIDGVQTQIPDGYESDGNGGCVPIDVCSNIDGNQTTVPDGYFENGGACYPYVCTNLEGGPYTSVPEGYFELQNGDCVQDVCPNIEGGQQTPPDGYFIDDSGNCVQDVCTNLEGNQASVPDGWTEEGGICTPPVDACLNIEGNQSVVPDGMWVDENSNCYPFVCTNLEGGPYTSVPEGYFEDEQGVCYFDVCPNLEGGQAEIPEGYLFDRDSETCYVPGVEIIDPGSPSCEALTFTITNTSDPHVIIPLVTWVLSGPVSDSGTINDLDVSLTLNSFGSVPAGIYTLSAWIGAQDGDADTVTGPITVEDCPGTPRRTPTPTPPPDGSTVTSGVLIPVTGIDDLQNISYLAAQLSNLGFGALGFGLLTHGFTLRKRNKKK